MPGLGVNIDHVATLREARGTSYPDLLTACRIVEDAGADGITVHLREDRRHIQDKDVIQLRRTVKTKLNLEMSLASEIVGIALKTEPDEVCIVPEKREELTTEGGLNIEKNIPRLARIIKEMHKRGVLVSIFIDPLISSVTAASEIGADCVELHTGMFADARNKKDRKRELDKLRAAARRTIQLGLRLNAGHGLSYDNVTPIAAIPGIRDLNIGHSIISRAVFTGLGNAVKEMKRIIGKKAGSICAG